MNDIHMRSPILGYDIIEVGEPADIHPHGNKDLDGHRSTSTVRHTSNWISALWLRCI